MGVLVFKHTPGAGNLFATPLAVGMTVTRFNVGYDIVSHPFRCISVLSE